MKRIILGFLVLCIAIMLSSVAGAKVCPITGEDRAEVDLGVFQDAVDDRDCTTVEVHGTFDFGVGGTVTIARPEDKSLDIVGVDGATIRRGGNGAKLIGGDPAALSVHSRNRADLAIRDLTFKDTVFSAIMIAGGKKLEVTGCTVKDILPGGSPFGAGQWPILILETYSVDLPFPGFPRPHSFIGDTVLVENNTVELADGEDIQYGIMVMDFGLDGESYPDIIIKDNTILHKGIPAEGETIGIFLAGVEQPITYVTNNTIENAATAGIYLKPHFGSMPSGVINAKDNTITGSGKYGIALFSASNCMFTISQGQIENLDASKAHVYCDPNTHDNKFKFFDVKRGDVKIIDQGKDNDNEFEWL